MSSAKRVVDSTIRRLLRYTAEIIISIILLILISLPLVFTIPMWIQEVVFDVPSSQLLVNPIAWFGGTATFGITIGLGIFSFILGYLFLRRIIPSTKIKEEPISDTEEVDEFEETELEEESTEVEMEEDSSEVEMDEESTEPLDADSPLDEPNNE